MIVVNLVAWAGPDFVCLPGELIELPDNIATDRIAAGLCGLPPEPEKPKSILFREKPAKAEKPTKDE